MFNKVTKEGVIQPVYQGQAKIKLLGTSTQLGLFG